MWQLFLSLAFAVLTLCGIALQKTYAAVPLKELKRRAQKADPRAQAIYKAAAYGLSLRVFLWIVIGGSTTGLFYVVARTFPWPLALTGILIILWLAFAWLPTTRVTAASQRLAVIVSPLIAWLLNYLHPALEVAGVTARRHSPAVNHSGLYQVDDIVELLKAQQSQADNRVTKEEIAIAIHALSFGDKLVRDYLTPLSQVLMVKQSDAIGPVLMDDLHKSGHSRFPVYDGKKSNLVGTLYLHDLIRKGHGGSVATVGRPEIFYIHEEQTLYQALQAFLKTKHHMFIVVNRFEEMVGVLTIEDVLEQVIGLPIVDEFDQYEDLRAVAGRMADDQHAEHDHEVS